MLTRDQLKTLSDDLQNAAESGVKYSITTENFFDALCTLNMVECKDKWSPFKVTLAYQLILNTNVTSKQDKRYFLGILHFINYNDTDNPATLPVILPHIATIITNKSYSFSLGNLCDVIHHLITLPVTELTEDQYAQRNQLVICATEHLISGIITSALSPEMLKTKTDIVKAALALEQFTRIMGPTDLDKVLSALDPLMRRNRYLYSLNETATAALLRICPSPKLSDIAEFAQLFAFLKQKPHQQAQYVGCVDSYATTFQPAKKNSKEGQKVPFNKA